MDKRVIFAVAGSGKTTYIVDNLCLNKRAIVLTYTTNNYENLKDGIIKRWGYIPSNISVMTYFNFLYSYCYKPVLSYRYSAGGINWKPNPNLYEPLAKRSHFIDAKNRLYSNRIAKLLIHEKVDHLVVERLEKFCDSIYIDEIQDFGGNDFNLLRVIASAKINVLFVGDFYQHTYDTSRDGSTNGSLHNSYGMYQAQFRSMGLTIDTTTLVKSHRCNPEICEFITKQLGIHIESNRTDKSMWYVISMENEAEKLFKDSNVVKLFYDEHLAYKCFSNNWGASKGLDNYSDVCVVMNRNSWKHLEDGILHKLKPGTKNKLYVAISRTKGNLYFVPDFIYKDYKIG